MARIIATDLQGELSQNGALTNTLFTRSGDRASIGDVGTVTIKSDTAFWQDPAFTLGCTTGLALSLDGVTYSADGASLYVGLVDSIGVQVWVKAVSQVASRVSLLIEQSGLVYTAIVNSVALPDVVNMSGSVQSSSQSGSSSVTSDLNTVTTSVSAVTVDVASGISVTVNADIVTTTSSIQASAQSGGSSVSAGYNSITGSIQAPTVVVPAASLSPGTYYFEQSGALGFQASAPTAADIPGSDAFPNSSLRYYARAGSGSWVATSSPVESSGVKTIPLTAAGGETTISIGLSEEGSPPPYTWVFTLPAPLAASAGVSIQILAVDGDEVVVMQVGSQTKIIVS